MRSYCEASILALFLGAIFGCSNSLFVESQEITQGEIERFRIGMNKHQVLGLARRDRVRAIRPIMSTISSIDYSNVSALTSPGNGRSLELSYSQWQKVIFTFDECQVVNVQLIGDSNESWKAFLGRASNELVVGLRSALTENHSLSVREAISSENHAWFSLGGEGEDRTARLDAYDVWSFSVSTIKPVGADFVVYFSEGSVARISYRRPRIHMD